MPESSSEKAFRSFFEKLQTDESLPVTVSDAIRRDLQQSPGELKEYKKTLSQEDADANIKD
jgi:hypothetical protein